MALPGREKALRSAFISFGSSRTVGAEALALALQQEDIALAGWSEDEFRTPSRIQDSINSSTVFLLLLAPGDEHSAYIQHETRLILQRCWDDQTSRVFVVSDAVGGIPSALRHQPFVSYFASDDVRLHEWSPQNPPTQFASRVVDLLDRSPTPPASPDFTAEQISDWRNRVVHVVGADGLDLDPQDRTLLIRQLRDDLKAGPPSDLDTSSASDWLLDRAIVASALGEYALSRRYYSRIDEMVGTPEEYRTADPARSYNQGVGAFEAMEYQRALELFGSALNGFDDENGQDDFTSIATRYNIALCHAGLGNVDEAVQYYEAAYTSATRTLGEHHPQTAAIATNLSSLYGDLGRDEQARALLMQALAAYEATRPSDSDEVVNTRARLEALGAPK